MPHVAGEGYLALKEWVLDNYDAVVAGETPFDFGNWQAQHVADDLLSTLGSEAGIFTPEEAEMVKEIPPEAYPPHVEPSSFAKTTMSTLSGVYNTLRQAGRKFISGLRSLFGG